MRVCVCVYKYRNIYLRAYECIYMFVYVYTHLFVGIYMCVWFDYLMPNPFLTYILFTLHSQKSYYYRSLTIWWFCIISGHSSKERGETTFISRCQCIPKPQPTGIYISVRLYICCWLSIRARGRPIHVVIFFIHKHPRGCQHVNDSSVHWDFWKICHILDIHLSKKCFTSSQKLLWRVTGKNDQSTPITLT